MGNDVDELIDYVSDHLEELKKLKPKEIEKMLEELSKEKHVWKMVNESSGGYLERALDEKTDNFLEGCIPHLVKALPQRLAYIASIEKDEDTIGDPVFDQVIMRKVSIKRLDDEQLVQFLRDFYNSGHDGKLKDSVGHRGDFKNHLRTVDMWLGAYDRRHAKDAHEAKRYLEEKRPKIFNLFIETIFPNMMSAIAKHH